MAFSQGEVCVDDGTTVLIDLSNTAIGSDVDVLRVVMWYYDRRHGAGTAIDDVDLSIQKRVGAGLWYMCLADVDNSADNRKRITRFTADLDSAAQYRMRLAGTNVTSDNEGCGNDSMRVFYAWFREDSDRETTENLPNVRPE